MDMKKSVNSNNTLKAESLQTNYLKIQIEKNFSTGNINRMEDINESSSMDNENDFSFNDDLNSLSSYEAELVNTINSNLNNEQQQSQDHPEIMFILDDNSTTYLDNPNDDIDKSISSIDSDIKANILNEENEAFKPNTQSDTMHYNNIDININDNNTINDNNENSINNKEKYPSIIKKNHLIPKELRETGSYSSLIYNELNKSLINHQQQMDNAMGSTDNLDNMSGYDSSTYSPTSMSSLINSPHSPKSQNLSKNSSKVSVDPSEKITSPSVNLTNSPLGLEENISESKQEDNKENEAVKLEENKQQKKLTVRKDVFTDKELDNFHRWVLCFCVVNFDLEVGQALEYVYPPTEMTDEEKKNVSFSAFPDSNSSSHKGNSIFCFRMKSGPSTERLYHHQHHFSPVVHMKSEDERFNGQINNPEKYQKDLKIDMDGYIYGYVFFRQQKDPTNKRGYFQKSFVLLSPHPFKGLFMKIVEKIGMLYFSSLKIGKTVDDEILIQKRQKIFRMAIAFINKWPNPPSILNERYFFIRSNSIKQTPPNMVLSFPFFKSIYPIMFAPANHYPQFFNTNTNSQNMNSQDKSSKIIIHQEMPVCPGRVYEIFRQSIGDAWQVWEMMILGEPILVLGDTPRSCSETVYTFMELIKPVPYGGDFRPYFTIQDSDFKNIVKKEATLPNVIIGTTNPVFNKALSHWPNIVYVQRKPCNNSMINNDKTAQQPVGVGKPIKRESQSIVSSLWTSLMPSNNMTTSSSLKNIATLFPNIGSSSSINNIASTASSSNSNIDNSATNSSSAASSQTIKNSSTPTPKTTSTATANTQSTAPTNNKNSGFSGFNWSSILNGSSSSASSNSMKHTNSHDITAVASEDNKNKSSQSGSKYGSFFSSLTMKKSNDGMSTGTPLNKDSTISANSSTSTLNEVTSLTPSASTSNLANDGDTKPAMPSNVIPTPPGKTNIECVEKVVTKHKSYFHKDKNVIKKITEAALMGYSLDIINNMFRRHFVELSEKFLQPLDYYFDKEVIYNVRLMKFSDLRFSPQIENFNIEAFLKIINETAPVFPLKCKRTLIEFYRLFIKSPNFSLWFLLRVCNAFREWRRRYFYVMCEGDIRYWIKTGSTRFYGNKATAKVNSTPATTSTAAVSSKGSQPAVKGKKPEELNVNVTAKVPNTNSDHNLRVRSPESIRARGLNGHTSNTFDTSTSGRPKNKEINVKTPKLIEIIELLMRYRDEIYHYEGLFVDKDVDLTSFSTRNLDDRKGKGVADATNSMSRASSGGIYQMRRTFSGSVENTPNASKTSLNTVGSEESSNTSVKEKETSSTTAAQDTQNTTAPAKATASRAKTIPQKNKKSSQPAKSGSLAEEATLNDLNDQEITKMYDREELIKRIFSNPEIEKFKKRKSRHRHIVLPIPLSCPTPKSTRFYENLTSMDDLILPTKDQYLKMKKQYKLLLNTFSEDLRAAIEAQLKN